MLLNKGIVSRDSEKMQESDRPIIGSARQTTIGQKYTYKELKATMDKHSIKHPECGTEAKLLKAMDNDLLYYCPKCEESFWQWQQPNTPKNEGVPQNLIDEVGQSMVK